MAILSADKLVVVKAFAPSNPLPLDAREIHDSLAEARAYAATSAIAYAGQTIKVVEDGNVTVYTLVPSEVEGENYALQFVGGGGSGIQSVGTSSKAGNITVVSVEGDTAVTKDVPVVGAFVDVAVTADTETQSEKTEFTYKDASNAEQKKAVYATGVRKVEAGSAKGKVKVTNADATGALSSVELTLAPAADPAYDATNRIITLPYLGADGTETALTVNLGKDMVVKSGTYDEETQKIVLTLTDDSTVEIPASALVDVYVGGTSNTATVAVGEGNTIVATVKVALSTEERNNLLKVDGANGLYVAEEDFTATKQLIVNAQAAAESKAAQLVAAAKQELQGDNSSFADEMTEEFNAVKALITAEQEARTAADTGIGTRIDNLQTAHGEDKAALEQSIADLEAADERIEGLITAETTARTEALAPITQDIADLKAADTAIGTRIGNLESTHSVDKAALEKSISDLDAAYKADDAALKTELEGKITAETTAREAALAPITQDIADLKAADTAIGTRIDGVVTAYEAADTALKTNLEGQISDGDAKALADAKDYALDLVEAEELARTEAFAAEEEARNTAINNAVSAEASARDTAIGKAIDDEEEARNTAINNAVSAEASARDTAIGTAVGTAKSEAAAYTDKEVQSCLTAAKAYADQVTEAAGVTWVDFGA